MIDLFSTSPSDENTSYSALQCLVLSSQINKEKTKEILDENDGFDRIAQLGDSFIQKDEKSRVTQLVQYLLSL